MMKVITSNRYQPCLKHASLAVVQDWRTTLALPVPLNPQQSFGEPVNTKSLPGFKLKFVIVRSHKLNWQGPFTVESLVKCTLPLVICVHNINSCARCFGWQYICLTCERCDMSSVNKRSTRVGATSKKLNWLAGGMTFRVFGFKIT